MISVAITFVSGGRRGIPDKMGHEGLDMISCINIHFGRIQ